MSSTDGAHLSWSALAASLLAGSIGLLVLGVQPVLLGSLVMEQRIDERGVGNLVTVEIIAIALGSLAGVRILRHLSPRLVAITAGLGLAAVNVLAIARGGLLILASARAVAGFAGGLLVAIAMIAIARSLRPERQSGLFLALQTLMQLVLAAWMPNLELQGSRADAGFMILAASGLLPALLATVLPSRLSPTTQALDAHKVSLPCFVALAAAGAFLGGIVTVWGYLGVWLGQHGHSPSTEATTVSIALAFQILGALLASRVSDRLNNRAVIVVASVAQCAIIGGLLIAPSSAQLVIYAGAAFGFIWLFTLPSFTGLLIELDPARRAVLYVVASQLAGAAALPSLAGLFVHEGNVDRAFVVGATTLLATIGLLFFSRPGIGVPAVGDEQCGNRDSSAMNRIDASSQRDSA